MVYGLRLHWSMKRRSILLIDDEEPILFALADFFAREGWEVRSARELEEALAILQYQHFELIVADLRLTGYGGTEGLEILHFIRERAPRTRVILLTAYGSPEVEARAMQLGVDRFLHKPHPLPELAAVAAELLETPAAATLASR